LNNFFQAHFLLLKNTKEIRKLSGRKDSAYICRRVWFDGL